MGCNNYTHNQCKCNCYETQYLLEWMPALNTQLEEINKQFCAIKQSIEEKQTGIYQIYATVATNNPMSVAAEYPTIGVDRVTYSTTQVLFSNMLNPQLVVLFKQPFADALPVYFKDLSNYEHIVTFGDTDTLAISSQLVNNYPYQAIYAGNYIILNPTVQTVENFKNGLLA